MFWQRSRPVVPKSEPQMVSGDGAGADQPLARDSGRRGGLGKLGLGVVALVLTGAGVWVYTWANRPQVAVLGTHQVQQLAVPSPVTAELQDVVAGLFATKIPSAFVIRERQDATGKQMLGRMVATETADGSGQIAITVRPLPDGGLSQTSDVHHRQVYGDRYIRESFDWLPPGAMAYRGSDGYELAVFMSHGGQYAAVVLSNAKDSRAYDEWLQTVVANWRWLP